VNEDVLLDQFRQIGFPGLGAREWTRRLCTGRNPMSQRWAAALGGKGWNPRARRADPLVRGPQMRLHELPE
jgi:hypothetical protein